MLAVLRDRHSRYEVVTFDNAPDIVVWFKERLGCCALICLDHDLGPNRERDGKTFDPGTGRDVSRHLATCAPICPVIVHTTNTLARPGMLTDLEQSGWDVCYVSPYADTLWIQEVWSDAVAHALT